MQADNGPTPEALFDGILKLQEQIMTRRVFTKQPKQVTMEALGKE